MANWRGAFRTNYFEVKDQAAFRAWVGSLVSEEDVEVFEGAADKFGLGAYGAVPNDRRASPSEIQAWGKGDGNDYNLSDLDQDFDFAAELAAHLVEEEIAIVQEVGWEKLCYLTGFGYAVDHTGEIIARGDIDDVTRLLPDGLTATDPAY